MGDNQRADHYVVFGYLRPILDYLHSRGLDYNVCLAKLGLQSDALHDADQLVADADYIGLLEFAKQELNDSHIGFHAGRAMQIRHLGIIGMLVMSSRYLHEVFDLHTRYQTLVGTGLRTQYITSGDELCMQILPKAAGQSRQSYEYNFGAWSQIRDMLVGSDVKPKRIELPYPKPDDDHEFQQIINTSIHYQAPVAQAIFDASFGNLELMPTNPELKRLLEHQANLQLRKIQGQQQHADPAITHLHDILVELLPHGPPPIQSVARRLNMSTRQLQRLLNRHQLNYRDCVNQLRSELAKQYIHNPDLSLVDVALMLGFSEQSSFSRAFKRWHNDSPGGYRRALSAPEKGNTDP